MPCRAPKGARHICRVTCRRGSAALVAAGMRTQREQSERSVRTATPPLWQGRPGLARHTRKPAQSVRHSAPVLKSQQGFASHLGTRPLPSLASYGLRPTVITPFPLHLEHLTSLAGSAFPDRSISSVALEGVVAAAEHLKVFGNGPAALRPRHDVVAFHLLVLEMSAADRAYSLLRLVCRPLLVLVELPEIQLLAPDSASSTYPSTSSRTVILCSSIFMVF